MTPAQLEAIRQRHARATKGPWGWSGYRTSRQVDLMGARTREVMAFHRWGMQSAQPVFTVDGLLVDAAELLRDCDPANPSRARITEIPHPDATFIAASWQDVSDLLAEVDRLRAALGEISTTLEDKGLRAVGVSVEGIDTLRSVIDRAHAVARHAYGDAELAPATEP